MKRNRNHHPKPGLCCQGQDLIHFSFDLSELFKLPNVWLIPTHSGQSIKSKFNPGIELQTNATPQWRYPFLNAYKRLVFLPALYHPLFLNFNPPRRTNVWRLAAS